VSDARHSFTGDGRRETQLMPALTSDTKLLSVYRLPSSVMQPRPTPNFRSRATNPIQFIIPRQHPLPPLGIIKIPLHGFTNP